MNHAAKKPPFDTRRKANSLNRPKHCQRALRNQRVVLCRICRVQSTVHSLFANTCRPLGQLKRWLSLLRVQTRKMVHFSTPWSSPPPRPPSLRLWGCKTDLMSGAAGRRRVCLLFVVKMRSRWRGIFGDKFCNCMYSRFTTPYNAITDVASVDHLAACGSTK